MADRRRALATALLGAVAVALLLAWMAGARMVRGEGRDTGLPTTPARPLLLRSSNGVRLAATYWPGSRPDSPGVLLLHGVGASRDATAPTARWLSARAYASLTLDFRGHGGSTITSRSFGWNEAADARAGFDWLKREQRGARVAVLGISMGGAAALLGPSGAVPADALVLQAVHPDIRRAIRGRLRAVLGPTGALGEPLLSLQSLPHFAVWPGQLSPVKALRRYRAPVLVIGGADDRYTPLRDTRALYDAAPAGRRVMWVAPGADHAQTSVLDTPEYRAVVAGFLRRTIGSEDGSFYWAGRPTKLALQVKRFQIDRNQPADFATPRQLLERPCWLEKIDAGIAQHRRAVVKHEEEAALLPPLLLPQGERACRTWLCLYRCDAAHAWNLAGHTEYFRSVSWCGRRYGPLASEVATQVSIIGHPHVAPITASGQGTADGVHHGPIERQAGPRKAKRTRAGGPALARLRLAAIHARLGTA